MISKQAAQVININPQVDIYNEVVKKAPPPYHIFEYLGEKFLYDTSSCQFFCIDDPMYHFLELCRVYPIDKARNIFQKEGLFSSDPSSTLAKFFKAKNGVFRLKTEISCF